MSTIWTKVLKVNIGLHKKRSHHVCFNEVAATESELGGNSSVMCNLKHLIFLAPASINSFY